MSLHAALLRRESDGRPIRVALVGGGKFGSMFAAQVVRTPGMRLVAIADRDPERVRETLARVGWPAGRSAAANLYEARLKGSTAVVDDVPAVIGSDHVDVVIEATGNPAAGIAHALLAFESAKHVVMVNVEADALAGPSLARRATEANVVYSRAWGDQPALIADLVDWARTAGFEVVAAGKGTKYLPAYHTSTPETVWEHYGIRAEDAAAGGMNATMFNSFLDGTKSAIEMAAVANACALDAPEDGLGFPPCDVDELADVLKPASEGGALGARGRVEVVSSLARDGSALARDLRWGVYATFAADTDYVRRCFAEYGLLTDASGNYAAMYKPSHLIGLELGLSVASIGVRGEATGTAREWRADVVAVAKRDLRAGERLDGEGGYTVWGKLVPSATSLALGALPLGLADGLALARDVAGGAVLTRADVVSRDDAAARFRAEMEASFAPEG